VLVHEIHAVFGSTVSQKPFNTIGGDNLMRPGASRAIAAFRTNAEISLRVIGGTARR
jgi:hypothetical protein